MEKEKLPLEKYVDLELEYKVYRFYDLLKRYFKVVLIVFLLVILTILGLYYKKQVEKEKKEKAAVYISKITDLLSENKISDARKEVEDFKKLYKNTDFYKVALAYEILINKEEGKEKENLKPAEELKDVLKTEISSGVKEYVAYLKNKDGNLKEAKDLLKGISDRNYNFISAQTLYALILKKEGNYEEAKKVFEALQKNTKYRYFSLLINENI